MTKFGLELEASYLVLPEVFFSMARPDPVYDPKEIIFNQKLADEIGFDLSDLKKKERTALLSGNQIPEGIQPFAQAYAGHQFGNFTMLGDGRAIVLGEHVTPSGQRYDIQFKGSGRTPYSRGGDGRAALGPMLREYVISEAMYALGIPTTRSLAVITTGEKVLRENELPGAILTRIAGSHIRVGTFEYASLHEDKTVTQALLDYLVDRHFPEIKDKENQPLALLEAVIQQQVDLITHWMRVGFIHGVMNTDNMALSGETIDYGPCAFMDHFNPETVFSSIDQNGRYSYANQPYIGQWNLARFAESLLPLFHEEKEEAIELAEHSLNSFESIYKQKWLSMMGNKLGFAETDNQVEKLVTELLNWMHRETADYTNTFRDLSHPVLPNDELYSNKDFIHWKTSWKEALKVRGMDEKSSFDLMRRVNPAVIPRNHKLEEALQAGEKGNLEPFYQMLRAIEQPYTDSSERKAYQIPPMESERVRQTFCGT